MASFLGFTMPIAPWAATAACLAWVVVHRVVALPFIASFVMVLILGAGIAAASGWEALPVGGAAAMMVLIVFSHRQNIAALLKERRRGGE